MKLKDFKTASFGKLTIVFSAVMLLFLAITAYEAHLKSTNIYIKNETLKLEQEIDLLMCNAEEKMYVHRVFERLEELGREGIEGYPKISSYLQQLEQEQELKIKAFFYKSNELVKSFNEDAEDLKLFTPLFHNLSLSGDEFMLAQREMQKMFFSFFGPGSRLELIKFVKGITKLFLSETSNRFFYWNNYPDNYGVFFVTTFLPSFAERVKTFTDEKPSIGAGDVNSKKYITPKKFTQDQMLAAEIQARTSGSPKIEAFDGIWLFSHQKNGNFICKVISNEGFFKETPRALLFISIFSIALLIILTITYLSAIIEIFPGNWVCKKLDNSSIKLRIIGLFAIASIFPIIFTYLIGSTAMAERKEAITNGIINESIAAIATLEELNDVALENCELAAKELREYVTHNPLTEEVFANTLAKYSLPRELARADVKDGDLTTLFSTDDREVMGVAEATDLFARVAVKQHASERLGPKAQLISPADIITESVFSTDEIGMAGMIRQRNRQWIFQMGTFPTIWYWDVYPELATGPVFISIANQINVHNRTLEIHSKNKIDPKGTMLFLTNLNVEQATFRLTPPASFDTTEIVRLAMNSYLTNKVIFRTVHINNEPYWLTAKMDKNIGFFVFIHLIAQKERLKLIESLKWQLSIACLFALIISLVGATFITRLIILPVQDLSAGVKAIRERNQEVRIPIRRNDELGVLATAFNKVIGELKELEYGKEVQESLLPLAPIIPEGYDIAFFTISATDLAGDYHDTALLNDGRLLVILGDVTGHGISASLAMAMAKATVNLAIINDIGFPENTLNSLNLMFNHELKPKHKFMTFVATVLDTVKHEVVFDNMGQCFPLFYTHATQTIEEIALPSMPLGAMKKRRAEIITKSMQPGDGYILYTDGIIECDNEAQEMFGYDRLQELFNDLMKRNLSANETITELMRELDDFRVAGMYPDDVTLVVVKRQQS
jgi:serine phosphatase RsbU (regulator of sigma subunit)